MLKKSVTQAIAIVLIASAVGVVANAAAPWKVAWISRPRTLEAVPDSLLTRRPPPPNQGKVVEPAAISLLQAKTLWDRKQAVFVDARPGYDYSDDHIPGAVSIPWDEIEYYQKQVNALSKNALTVVYCAGESCDLSIHLGDYLAKRGFTRVLVFFGGWVSWKQAGYPVTNG